MGYIRNTATIRTARSEHISLITKLRVTAIYVRTFQPKPNYLQAVATSCTRFLRYVRGLCCFFPHRYRPGTGFELLRSARMDRAAAQHDFFGTRNRPPAAPAKLSSSFPKVYRKLNGALMISRFPCAVFMVYLWIVRAFLRPAACPCTQRMYVAVNCEGVSIIFSSILCRHFSV